MATTERPIAVGVFRDRTLARRAIDELKHAGFRDDEILMDGHGARAGSLLDHLASTFTGQGAEDEKLSDELMSKGIPENDSGYYQQEIDAGRTVVVVESYGHWQEARDILYRFGAYDASSHPEEGERIIPVREEELRIHKQAVTTGEVIVRKEIITEEKTFTVPVSREELVIERRSGQSTDQAAYQGELSDEVLKDGGTLRIILREEQVLIEKQPVMKEEILISKRQIQETKHIEDTVRREEAHIERTGEVNIHGSEVEDTSGASEQNG